ncbi:MAG: peptidase [Deltaproteobacteria bacterium]|nr:peptidase [Deltaproteobacteria bacterium]
MVVSRWMGRLALAGTCLGSLVALAACGDNAFPLTGELAGRCAAPRTGVDPATGAAYPDLPGSLDAEKAWVRGWIDDYYLWYREVGDPDPDSYGTVVDYFDALKTSATTATGHDKDRFHFTYTTAAWEALSQSGIEAGYGVRWAVIAPRPPRQIVVAYTEPGSAGAAALVRGAEVLAVDGADVVFGAAVDTLNGGLFPADVGEAHTFLVQDLGGGAPRTVTLTSANITSQPVQNVRTLDGGAVGYLQFNDHIATAEAQLIAAIDQLKTAGVTDLVIDLRYNGGGYLAIASELGYMVAGPASDGQVFERIAFNDKYPTTNPITGMPLEATPFFTTAVFSQVQAPLPSLGLTRVFVLTGPGTCSASEAVMNGLAGIDVEVIQIGSTTCGKPYGFYPQDNCGTTYFAIQFQGVNAKGFGDYADGFSADPAMGAPMPGCVVPDDFTHALGDPAEARLAAALQYRRDGTCPAVAKRAGAAPLSAVDGQVIKPPWLENRIYRPIDR